MATQFPSFFVCFTVITAIFLISNAELEPDFYDEICPMALPTIKMVVEQAIKREPRMGASLLRLHFHDCFVNGCDGSLLLDDTPNFIGEKTAAPNLNSARGFEVIDDIKTAVNQACHGNIVSCADILAVAARDSVAALGGPSYQVLLGRKDSKTASRDDANEDIPRPFLDFPELLDNFESHGLNLKDLVVLTAGHTIGLARCTSFRNRIYNDTNIDAFFAAQLRKICPLAGGDGNLAPLDGLSTRFDTIYFNHLLLNKGLLHSDQELFRGDGSASDGLVRYYSYNPMAFWDDFGASMVKMGNMDVLTSDDDDDDNEGEIRMNCRKVNY